MRSPSPLVPLSFFRRRTLTGANVDRPAARQRGLRDVLPALAVHAAGARLLGARDRLRLPRGRADRGRRVRHRPGARYEDRRQAGARDRAWRCSRGGLLYFTQISVGGSYVGDLLPGFILIGVGLGFSFVPVSIAALAGIESREAGLASGLINTNQQIGGAIGLAILTTVATTRTDNLLDAAIVAAGGARERFLARLLGRRRLRRRRPADNADRAQAGRPEDGARNGTGAGGRAGKLGGRHGCPEAKDIEVPARQAPRPAQDRGAEALGLPCLRQAEGVAPHVSDVQDVPRPRGRAGAHVASVAALE